MKKKLLVLFLVLEVISFSTSCYIYEYEKKDGKVIFSQSIVPGGHTIKTNQVKKADLKTFEVLDKSEKVARDKKNFYYMGKLVKGIDGETVEVVNVETKNPDMGKKIIDGIEVTVRLSTAAHCFKPYITEVRDKNGNHLIMDIQSGMYELVE